MQATRIAKTIGSCAVALIMCVGTTVAEGSAPILYDYAVDNRVRVVGSTKMASTKQKVFGWAPEFKRYFWFADATRSDKGMMTVKRGKKAVSKSIACDVIIKTKRVKKGDDSVDVPANMHFDCDATAFFESNAKGVTKAGLFTAVFDYYAHSSDKTTKAFATLDFPVVSYKENKKMRFHLDYDAYVGVGWVGERRERDLVGLDFVFWSKTTKTSRDLRLTCRNGGKVSFEHRVNSPTGYYGSYDPKTHWSRHHSMAHAWLRLQKGSTDTRKLLADGKHSCKAKNKANQTIAEFSFSVADGKLTPSGCEKGLMLLEGQTVIKGLKLSQQLKRKAGIKKLGIGGKKLPKGCY